MTATDQALDFDADALRAKYRAERDKRIRDEGNDQYVNVVGSYARFTEDPFATTKIKRETLADEVNVLIVGGGFGGLLTGAHLRERGIDDIRIIEKGSDFGGTWYWNRYPGAQCDIESYIYMPLLEELGYMPKEKYACGDEILDYTKALAHHFDMYRDALFQTEVTGVTSRPTRSGQSHWMWVGSRNESATSTQSWVAASPRLIWSTMAGPTSSAGSQCSFPQSLTT